MRIKQHTAIPNPDGLGFRVKYPDGVLSQDFYNKARASNHAQVLNENDRRSAYR